MRPKDFQNFLINLSNYSKKIKNTGILCSLWKSKKSVWLGSVRSMKENLLDPVQLSLASLGLARLSLQCAKPLSLRSFVLSCGVAPCMLKCIPSIRCSPERISHVRLVFITGTWYNGFKSDRKSAELMGVPGTPTTMLTK